MKILKTITGRIVVLVVLGIAVLGISQMQIVGAQNQVTRPFKIEGELIGLDLFNWPPTNGLNRGIASEIGKFVGILTYPDWEVRGIQILFAANGDQLWVKDEWDPSIPGWELRWQIIGGTGRFESASGEWTHTEHFMYPVPGPDGTMSLIVIYKGEGYITY